MLAAAMASLAHQRHPLYGTQHCQIVFFMPIITEKKSYCSALLALDTQLIYALMRVMPNECNDVLKSFFLSPPGSFDHGWGRHLPVLRRGESALCNNGMAL